MSKIAIIKTGGKQYKVEEKQVLKIEKLDLQIGDPIKFETFLVSEGESLELGKPSLGERVEGKVLEQGKADKVSVIKFKNKTRYKKNVGHRQLFTKMEITEIK